MYKTYTYKLLWTKSVIAISVILVFSVLFFTDNTNAQTVGLIQKKSSAFEGYTMFAPIMSKNTYLINMEGLLVHQWESDYNPGLVTYFLDDGNLLRTCDISNSKFKPAGGSSGKVQLLDWESNELWSFEYSGEQFQIHHDIELLPNGNVLMIAWEVISKEDALAAGRNPATITSGELWPDKIIEVKPDGATGGDIVWEWRLWDHIVQDYDASKANFGVIEDHPELLDLNYNLQKNPITADWNHFNSVDYNFDLDQIIISVHNMNEIYIIDHSTTKAEAAGHTGGQSGKGGDILYRWGNPAVYGRGNSIDQKLFLQHDAQWIENGLPGENNILIFNNGTDRQTGSFSSVDEISLPVDSEGNYTLETGTAFGPTEQEWIYTNENPEDFYGVRISGAQRLPNGNTLICNGPLGQFFEVTLGKEIIWEYVNPVIGTGPLTQGDPVPENGMGGFKNTVFRSYRFAPDYSGFNGKVLTPGDPIEIYLHTSVSEDDSLPLEFALQQNFPNPFNPSTVISFSLPETQNVTLNVFNLLGSKVATLIGNTIFGAGNHSVSFNAQNLPSGLYVYQLCLDEILITKKMMLLK